MLKSILSVFSGALGMILKVMLVILLVFIAGYCLFSMLTMPFVWGGVIRTGIIAVCAFLIRFLLRLGRDEDDGIDDGLPRREGRS